VLPDGAGVGINGVHLEVLVDKMPPDPIGACCVDGVCVGDVMQISCDFQGGFWNFGASCGDNPDLPPPICEQAECSFNNGTPLDDTGAPVSQYAPDARSAAGAADDFTLRGSGNDPCRINQIRAWTTHADDPAAVDPLLDYEGINVTIYENAASQRPAGQPENDGTHRSYYHGGIVYSQTISMSEVTAVQVGQPPCIGSSLWQLDIPADVLVNRNTRYWLEIQPIMNSAELGHVRWLLSESNNDHPGQRINPSEGVTQWSPVGGNDDACPGGDPATPPAGTRTNLAFELTGETFVGAPLNDLCADSIPVEDGVVPFSNDGANTDGPDEPEMCDFFEYSQVGSDVWFDYSTPCTGDLTISLCGSDYDTKLAVYDGCGFCPPRGRPVACNEDAQAVCGLQSQVSFPVEQGSCYTIRAGGYLGEQGKGILSIDCEPPPPPTGACCNEDGVCLGTMSEVECEAEDTTWFEGEDCAVFECPVTPPPNDECSTCIPVFAGEAFVGSSLHATGSVVSSCGGNDTADVWHCWTADRTGVAIFDLCDSAYDTTLSVFDACGGEELACNDDACGSRSLLELFVEEGVTYYVRVAGFNGATGDYTFVVYSGAAACCPPSGAFCVHRTPEECHSVGGIPQGPGTVCLGDNNGNGMDDACESCPDAQIILAEPLDGTVDARQPHEYNASLPRQGIGSPGPPAEPITIHLDPPVSGAEDCFVLCETAADSLLGPNSISTVTEVGSGVYSIVLDHAITAGAVTTIEYMAGGGFVEYTSHPANVDSDSASSAVDILAIIDILNGAAASPWGIYSEDIDHSGLGTPADILRVIDLLNGADEFDIWLGVTRPENTSCP
jgi:hypothetical protein